MNINECYSLASGHFLTERIPEALLDAFDEDWLSVFMFIENHTVEFLEDTDSDNIWELIEGIGMDYYKLTNAGIK